MYKSQAEEMRDWLKAYVNDENEIDELLEKLRMTRARATSIGAQEISDMPKAPTNTSNSLEEYIIRVEQLENLIRDRMKFHRLTKNAIERVIEELSENQRSIIRYRYIEGLEWRDVVSKCYQDEKDLPMKRDAYTKRVYREHERALQEMSIKWTEKTDRH